jgi:hypothetical protein
VRFQIPVIEKKKKKKRKPWQLKSKFEREQLSGPETIIGQ